VSFFVGIVPTLDGENGHFVFLYFNVRSVEFRAVCGDEQRSVSVTGDAPFVTASWSQATRRSSFVPDASRTRDTVVAHAIAGIPIAQGRTGRGPVDGVRVPWRGYQ
jgi:hypothetical protein